MIFICFGILGQKIQSIQFEMKVSMMNVFFRFNNCSWTLELYGNTPLILLGSFKLLIQSGSGTSRSLIPAVDWIKLPGPYI